MEETGRSTARLEAHDEHTCSSATGLWNGRFSWVGLRYRRLSNCPLDDCRRVFTTSKGQVSTAPAVPPQLYRHSKTNRTGGWVTRQYNTVLWRACEQCQCAGESRREHAEFEFIAFAHIPQDERVSEGCPAENETATFLVSMGATTFTIQSTRRNV
jgi:hypothetical protein